MSPEDYTTAMDLLGDGIDRLAALNKKHGISTYKALLSPTEYADLALRLGNALSADRPSPPSAPNPPAQDLSRG